MFVTGPQANHELRKGLFWHPPFSNDTMRSWMYFSWWLETTKFQIHKLFDGGEVGLDWISPDGEVADNAPIVLFLPGLTGDSQSEYIKSFVNIARWRLKARCVVFNFRGRGGHDLKTPRTYCASNSEDLASVIDHIKATYPDAPVLALGVSLGGIILG